MLAGVRPSGERRSWWLREALAAEAAADPALADAAPPLRGTITADVVILGGGYTGLWTALRLAELAPEARIVLLEADICGGGPSGRNGGFVTGWWDEMPTLIERYGEVEALDVAWAMDGAVDELGRWCAEHGVDAWYTKAGTLSVSAAPAQDGRWLEATTACASLGVGDRYVALGPDDIAARVASPVFRGGSFMPGAATIQPAILARGLRRGRPRTWRDDPRGHARRRARRRAAGLAGRDRAPGRDGPRSAVPVARSASARHRRPARARSSPAPRSWPSTPGRRRGRRSVAGSSRGRATSC